MKPQYVWSPVYVDALVLRDRDTNADATLDERLYVAQDANHNVTGLFDKRFDFFDWLANKVIGTDNVLRWDSVLGDPRTGWFAQVSNFAAGWGDTLSFGLTSYARQGLGYDDVLDYRSGAYFWGQVTGTAHGIAMMGAGSVRNAVIQARGGARGGLWTYFWDPRQWDSVRRVWSDSQGGLAKRGLALHHVIFPQRWNWIPLGLRNAGFNYMPMSAWRNSVLLNMFPRLGRPFEWVYRFGYITQFNPLVNPFLGRYPGSYYDWANASLPVPAFLVAVAIAA